MLPISEEKEYNPFQTSLLYQVVLIFLLADLFALFEVAFSGAIIKEVLKFLSQSISYKDFFVFKDFFESRPVRLNLLLFNTFTIMILIFLAPFLISKRIRKWLLDESRLVNVGAFVLVGFVTILYFAHIWTFSQLKLRFFAILSELFFISIWLMVMGLISKFTSFKFWDYRIIFLSSLGIFRSLVLIRIFTVLVHSGGLKIFGRFLCMGTAGILGAILLGVFFSWLSWRWRWGVRVSRALAGLVFAVSLWNLSLPPREWLKIYFKDTRFGGLLGSGVKGQSKSDYARLKHLPNVVLIVMDTVRADHLSLYGYERKTTPFLDWLGAHSVVFERAYATSSWTVPSHASIFTGLLPGEHKCTYENLRLYRDITTLAERLQKLGYLTLGYSNNPAINRMSGLVQGFDKFECANQLNAGAGFFSGEIFHWLYLLTFRLKLITDSGAKLTNKLLKKWFWRLSEQDRPFFLFVNFMEAHLPYPTTKKAFRFVPEPKKAQRRFPDHEFNFYKFICQPPNDPEFEDYIIRRYDGAIYYLDSKLAGVWRKLSRFGFLNNTIIVILSDHGELFGAHNFWGHAYYLWEPLIHIPLIIFYPRLLTPKRVKNPVSLMEVPEMIMELINGRVPRQISHPASEPILSEVYYPWGLIDTIKNYCLPEQLNRFRRRQKAVIEWPYKLIWDSRGKDLLFNIEKDPQEKIDLKNEKIRTYAELSSFIDLYRARMEILERKTPAIDAVTRNALRALGYVR